MWFVNAPPRWLIDGPGEVTHLTNAFPHTSISIVHHGGGYPHLYDLSREDSDATIGSI